MEHLYIKRNIIAIDLKSFFAACECIERKLDLFTTPLVVCDPTRNGAITLAVTPYLKSLGVSGRTRAYKLPKNIKIMKVPPRMSLYIKKSKEVINIYLDYVSIDDLHIYSIDEVFLDVTDYLSLYKKDVKTLAVEILDTIKTKTGLVASAGIGPNLLLAKVAMDLDAKNNKDNIAIWSYDDIKTKLWTITPLSEMWGIGSRMEKRLNLLNINTIGDLANYDKNILKDKFGVMGLELWNHANGIDLTKIIDLKKEAKDKSINHSQVLFKDYNATNIPLIIREMLEVLTRRLRNMKQACLVVGFGISYSKNVGGGFWHSIKLDNPTKDIDKIYLTIMNIFDRYYEDMPIRKVSISLGGLTDDNFTQLNLFETEEEINLNNQCNKTIDNIKDKYGSNSIIKASSLLKDSTAIKRNKKIGGHDE